MKLNIRKKAIILSLMLSISTAVPAFADTVTENIPIGESINTGEINSSVKLDDLSTVKPTIEKDLGLNVQNTESTSTEGETTTLSKGFTIDTDFSDGKIDGILKQGVSVVVYKLDSKDIQSKSFSPSADKLISDSKFTISNSDGRFSIPVNTSGMTVDSYVAVSISYPVESGGNTAVKTFYLSIPFMDSSVYSKYRISGNDRFDTNIESIKAGFPQGADTAIVTSGYNFADPLVAGPLAIKLKAPIIFSGYQGLESKQLDLIKSLGVKNLIVVGGEDYVPDGIKDQIKGLDRFTRISGADRYETAKKLLDYYGYSEKIVLADGRKFQDALSATPLAKSKNAPIMIVGGTLKGIDMTNYKDVTIVGGTNSVPESVQSDILSQNKDANIVRVSGVDRTETSLKSAQMVGAQNNILVNKDKFADALSGINLLVKMDAGLVLVGKDSLGSGVSQYINGKTNYIVGGENSVSKLLLKY